MTYLTINNREGCHGRRFCLIFSLSMAGSVGSVLLRLDGSALCRLMRRPTFARSLGPY